MSAFFSSTETALFSLDEMKIKRLKYKNARKKIRLLLQNTSILLITILTGNTLVNTAATSLLERELGIGEILYSTIVVTAIILFLGEITPKTIAIMRVEAISSINSHFIYPVYFIFKPISSLINGFTDLITHFLKKIHKKKATDMSRDNLLALSSIVSREKIFNKEEKKLIESVINFTSRKVWNIMTPRTKVFSVEKNLLLKEVIKLEKKNKASKIPVYDQTDDNLVGVIYLRELFPYIYNPEKATEKKAADIMKPMYFVPETKNLPEMLEDFKRKKIQIAAVVDEYGSALGIVTIADVLGEIVGELMDESFVLEKKIIKLGKERYIVSGDISLDDFNDYFGSSLSSKEYETLAGYFIEKTRDIPQKGYSKEIEDYIITVKETTGKNIEQFIIEKK